MADIPTIITGDGFVPPVRVYYTPVMRMFDHLLLALAAHNAAAREMDRLRGRKDIPDACEADAKGTQRDLSGFIDGLLDTESSGEGDECLLDFARILEAWREAFTADQHPDLRQLFARMNALRCDGRGPVPKQINRQLARGRKIMCQLMRRKDYVRTTHLSCHSRLLRPAPPWLA